MNQLSRVKLSSLLIFMVLGSCQTQRFYLGNRAESANARLAEETMQDFWFAGIGQTRKIGASKICGGQENVSHVETELNAMNGFIAVISGGIYTPRMAKVYCKR